MSVKVVFKSVLAGVIAVIAIWAFRAPMGDQDDVQSTELIVGDPDAEYMISIFPGEMYMPNAKPFGMGDPLKGFKLVAEDFVKLHPETAIVFRNVPAQEPEWIVTQMLSDEAPDIISTNVEEMIWPYTHKGWWVQLDAYFDQPNPFVAPGDPGSDKWWDMFKFQAITRGKADHAGKMYCLTYDMVETGIFYNKTKFEALGLEVPTTWAEFITIQQKILEYNKAHPGERAYIPFITDIQCIADWGVDLLLDQFYGPILDGIDLYKDPVREEYLKGYLDWNEITVLHEHGFFSKNDPRWVELFSQLKDWRQYWGRSLGRVYTTGRMKAFIQQRGLMVWDGSWSVHRLSNDDTLDFEWGVFYLPPIGPESSRFGHGREMCVIGGAGQQYGVTKSAHRDSPDDASKSKRLEYVIRFLQFMTLPENADRIINERKMFIPNIVDVPVHPELKAFDDILKRRYTTTKYWGSSGTQFRNEMERMLMLYLNDGCTLEEYLETMDDMLARALNRLERRRQEDLSPLRQRYDELAPLREGIKELPHGAR